MSTDTLTSSETNTETLTSTESNTETNTETGTGSMTSTETETETNSMTNTETETGTGTNTNTESGTGTGTGIGTETEASISLPVSITTLSIIISILSSISALFWLITYLKNSGKVCSKVRWLSIVGILLLIVLIVSWFIISAYVEDVSIINGIGYAWFSIIVISLTASLYFALTRCEVNEEALSLLQKNARQNANANRLSLSPRTYALLNPWRDLERLQNIAS